MNAVVLRSHSIGRWWTRICSTQSDRVQDEASRVQCLSSLARRSSRPPAMRNSRLRAAGDVARSGSCVADDEQCCPYVLCETVDVCPVHHARRSHSNTLFISTFIQQTQHVSNEATQRATHPSRARRANTSPRGQGDRPQTGLAPSASCTASTQPSARSTAGPRADAPVGPASSARSRKQ